MNSTSRSYGQGFKGQALVEIALGLPLVLLLIFGVLELGRAFFTKIALTNAAREGANFLVYNRDDVDTAFVYTRIHVQKELTNSGVTAANEDILIQCLEVTIDDITKQITGEVVDNDCPSLSTVEVVITNTHHVTIFGFLTGPIEMQSNARMVLP